jgi:regulator of protease activity HflC (stomatin/prohibitin superfamily)
MNRNEPQTELDTTVREADEREGSESLSRALQIGIVGIYLLAFIMLLVIASQSFLTVKQHEIALIYRLGQIRAVVGNGLHLTWPYPIEQAEVFPVSRARQIESRSFLASPSEATRETFRPGIDGYLLSGDRNIVHVKCSLTYFVNAGSESEILNYFVMNEDVEEQIEAFFDNAVLKAAAELDADRILFEPDVFRGRVASLFRQCMMSREIGIQFEPKDISVSATAPLQARSAFNALNQAGQRSEKLVNDAVAHKTKTVRESESLAARRISEEEGERIRRISSARADAATFLELLRQRERNPGLIERSIYEDSMFRVLENVEEKFVVRKDSDDQIRILFGRNPDKGKARADETTD